MNKSSKSLAQTLNQEHVAGLVCTSPFIIGLFAFLLIPMGMSLYYSLCNYSFRCFREAYLIGGAHPNEQLYSIQHFLQNNFMNMNYARLEAASILVVLFVGAFVLIGMYLAKKRNNR